MGGILLIVGLWIWADQYPNVEGVHRKPEADAAKNNG